MKIREIVTENSNVDEALGTAWNLAKAAGKELIGKGAQAAAKDSEVAIKGQGPKWAQWVNRQSNKIGDIKSTARSNVRSTATATFTLTSSAMSLLKYWQMLDPFLVYNKHMEQWEKQLAQGKITEEQYEAIREKELTQLVGQVATILATNGMIRAGIMPVLGFFRVFGLNTIHAFVNTLTKASQGALMMWWNSNEGRAWIASVLALGVIGDQDWASTIIGGNIARQLDRLKGKVKAAPVGGSEEPASNPQGTEKTPDSPADNVSNQKKNPQDYEYHSPTLVRNKKTGELEMRDF